jgi:hypothetical protein
MKMLRVMPFPCGMHKTQNPELKVGERLERRKGKWQARRKVGR